MRLPNFVLSAASAALFVLGQAGAAETIAATDARVAWMGRTVVDAGTASFAYPGVSAYLRFDGGKLVMDVASTGRKSWLDIVVDGQVRAVHLVQGRSRVVLVDRRMKGQRKKESTVQVLHRSETWQGTVTVRGFTTDGAFAAPPELPPRRLMVLGDSVTCGEALDRTPPGKKDAVWWNPRLSYGMLAGQALQAQVHLVCHGGRGLVRSWNGRTDEFNLGRLYELAIADPPRPVPWDQHRYAPDLIVSAIGTNDFTPGIPEREAYVTEYVTLVQTLLRDHPPRGRCARGQRHIQALPRRRHRRPSDPRPACADGGRSRAAAAGRHGVVGTVFPFSAAPPAAPPATRPRGDGTS